MTTKNKPIIIRIGWQAIHAPLIDLRGGFDTEGCLDAPHSFPLGCARAFTRGTGTNIHFDHGHGGLREYAGRFFAPLQGSQP